MSSLVSRVSLILFKATSFPCAKGFCQKKSLITRDPACFLVIGLALVARAFPYHKGCLNTKNIFLAIHKPFLQGLLPLLQGLSLITRVALTPKISFLPFTSPSFKGCCPCCKGFPLWQGTMLSSGRSCARAYPLVGYCLHNFSLSSSASSFVRSFLSSCSLIK